jgi:hypothetical protein
MMFWKKDKGGVATPEKQTDKVRKSSPKDVMAERIDALESGKEITFKLGEIYVKPYITVARNATGKKFTVFQDGKDAAGMPSGKRGKFWDVDHAKDIVHWIMEREGTVYKA